MSVLETSEITKLDILYELTRQNWEQHGVLYPNGSFMVDGEGKFDNERFRKVWDECDVRLNCDVIEADKFYGLDARSENHLWNVESLNAIPSNIRWGGCRVWNVVVDSKSFDEGAIHTPMSAFDGVICCKSDVQFLWFPNLNIKRCTITGAELEALDASLSVIGSDHRYPFHLGEYNLKLDNTGIRIGNLRLNITTINQSRNVIISCYGSSIEGALCQVSKWFDMKEGYGEWDYNLDLEVSNLLFDLESKISIPRNCVLWFAFNATYCNSAPQHPKQRWLGLTHRDHTSNFMWVRGFYEVR